MYAPLGMVNVKCDFVWIPRYGGNRPTYSCDIWLYTKAGNVPDIGKCDINKFIGGKPLPWFIGGSVSNVTTNNIVKADGIGIATSQYPLSYFQRILGYWRSGYDLFRT